MSVYMSGIPTKRKCNIKTTCTNRLVTVIEPPCDSDDYLIRHRYSKMPALYICAD